MLASFHDIADVHVAKVDSAKVKAKATASNPIVSVIHISAKVKAEVDRRLDHHHLLEARASVAKVSAIPRISKATSLSVMAVGARSTLSIAVLRKARGKVTGEGTVGGGDSISDCIRILLLGVLIGVKLV